MLYAIITVLVLILDQAVKYWATVSIALDEGSITLIPGVISIVNIHNSGAAFGIFQNARWLFIIIAIIFAVVVVVALWKNIIRDPMGRWSAVLVLSGAIGNCIDRVMNGFVVDMFRFDFMNFAVFNVADIFITICGILFCLYIIFTDEFRGRDKDTENTGAPKKGPRAEAKKPYAAKQSRMPAAPPAAPDKTGVRTYKPKAQVVPVKPGQDPFSEWESLPPLDARGGAPNPVVAVSVTSKEAVSKAPAAVKSAQPRMEYSLDDILAEYSSK